MQPLALTLSKPCSKYLTIELSSKFECLTFVFLLPDSTHFISWLVYLILAHYTGVLPRKAFIGVNERSE